MFISVHSFLSTIKSKQKSHFQPIESEMKSHQILPKPKTLSSIPHYIKVSSSNHQSYTSIMSPSQACRLLMNQGSQPVTSRTTMPSSTGGLTSCNSFQAIKSIPSLFSSPRSLRKLNSLTKVLSPVDNQKKLKRTSSESFTKLSNYCTNTSSNHLELNFQTSQQPKSTRKPKIMQKIILSARGSLLASNNAKASQRSNHADPVQSFRATPALKQNSNEKKSLLDNSQRTNSKTPSNPKEDLTAFVAPSLKAIKTPNSNREKNRTQQKAKKLTKHSRNLTHQNTHRKLSHVNLDFSKDLSHRRISLHSQILQQKLNYSRCREEKKSDVILNISAITFQKQTIDATLENADMNFLEKGCIDIDLRYNFEFEADTIHESPVTKSHTPLQYSSLNASIELRLEEPRNELSSIIEFDVTG